MDVTEMACSWFRAILYGKVVLCHYTSWIHVAETAEKEAPARFTFLNRYTLTPPPSMQLNGVVKQLREAGEVYTAIKIYPAIVPSILNLLQRHISGFCYITGKIGHPLQSSRHGGRYN